MTARRKKILLVVDGSYQSYETVNYVSGVLPTPGTEMVLFHVASKVPEAFWDLEKDPAWQQRVQTVRGWEIQQEKKIGEFMKRAHQVFTDAKFPKSSIKIKVCERKEGIARDIGAESHRGYAAVILGRRGLSTIQDLSLGGVASKVVLKVNDLAVWLVGGRPDPGGFLIGIDSSRGAMLAVNHVAVMTAGRGKKVLLLHVVRNVGGTTEELESPGMDTLQKERTEKAVAEIGPVLREASERLRSGGLNAENISTKIVTGASTRAGTIMEEARAGGYGTIVVGRRGVSTVEDFDMGRVTNKLVQTSKDRALWVVG